MAGIVHRLGVVEARRYRAKHPRHPLSVSGAPDLLRPVPPSFDGTSLPSFAMRNLWLGHAVDASRFSRTRIAQVCMAFVGCWHPPVGFLSAGCRFPRGVAPAARGRSAIPRYARRGRPRLAGPRWTHAHVGPPNRSGRHADTPRSESRSIGAASVRLSRTR